jgi:hypothetical protein
MKKKRARRPPMIEVRHSRIHGHGVFALRRIRRGTTVIEYLGDRVSHEDADARYENKDPKDNHTFLFTVDSKTVIDGGVNGNDARYINHGCDPNCQSTSAGKRIFIEAIRTIRPGEELAYDYQIQRDADDAPDVDTIFACHCGADRCRGSMLEASKTPRKRKAARRPAGRAAKRGAEGAAKRGAKGAAKRGAKGAAKRAVKSRGASKRPPPRSKSRRRVR